MRKTGIWRNADAAGESRCNRHQDPFTWINIVLPAAARLTKQKDYYTQQSFIWVVVEFDKLTSFFFNPRPGKKGFLFPDEEQQIAHLWLWPESYCYHLVATFGTCNPLLSALKKKNPYVCLHLGMYGALESRAGMAKLFTFRTYV